MTPRQQQDIRAEIQNLTQLMNAFGALLESETAALRKADFRTVDQIQGEKRQMARTYHDQATVLAALKSEMAGLDPAVREKFIRTRTAFTHILGENMKVLDAVKSSAGRLMERIRTAALDGMIEERQTHYSPSGRVGSWNSAGLSLSLDSSL